MWARAGQGPGGWQVLGRTRHIHFVGIGGTGMSGIAEVLINLGYAVSGSDLTRSEVTRRLVSLGGRVHTGHRAEHVREADVVVVSSAIDAGNPEVAAARAHGIPVIPRAEMLAELMRVKHGVAVGGAHGKTTTTWLTGLVLDHGGCDPTIVVGGRLKSLRTGARLGRGEFLVAEADESDGSFLNLSPAIAIVTTMAAEHLDHYGDYPAVEEAFVRFLNHVPFYGAALCCIDDPGVRAILPRVEKRVVTYGFADEANVRATDFEPRGPVSAFRVQVEGREVGSVELNLPGRHNVSNALAAIAVGVELGIPFMEIRAGLEAFTGIARRMEVRGEEKDVLWVDDYAHHPDEIAATLEAARQVWQGRLVAVFQPHRYTRTRALAGDFGGCFGRADELFVTALYAAGEKPIPGVDAGQVARAVEKKGEVPVHYVPARDELVARLAAMLEPGDTLMTLGAGDVWRIGERVMRLRRTGVREVAGSVAAGTKAAAHRRSRAKTKATAKPGAKAKTKAAAKTKRASRAGKAKPARGTKTRGATAKGTRAGARARKGS